MKYWPWGKRLFKNRLDLRLYTQSQVQSINFCLVILSWFQWKRTAEYFQESVTHPESTCELIKNMSRRVELRPEPGKRQQEKFTFLCRVITSTNTQDSIQLHHWRRSDTSLWGILHLPIVDTTTHTHTQIEKPNITSEVLLLRMRLTVKERRPAELLITPSLLRSDN